MTLFVARKGKEESKVACILMKNSLAMETLSAGRQGREMRARLSEMLGDSHVGGQWEGVVSVFSLSDLGHTPFHLLVVPLCLSDCLDWGGSERQLVSRQASSLGSSCLVRKPPFCHLSRSQGNRGSRRQNQHKDAS